MNVIFALSTLLANSERQLCMSQYFIEHVNTFYNSHNVKFLIQWEFDTTLGGSSSITSAFKIPALTFSGQYDNLVWNK